MACIVLAGTVPHKQYTAPGGKIFQFKRLLWLKQIKVG